MFANFAAKRHLTGPLRAVSPVVAEEDVDWKSASKVANRQVIKRALPEPNANSQKLMDYLAKNFQGQLPRETVSFKQSAQLAYVEAVSLGLPLLYILSILALITLAIFAFAQPMLANIVDGNYLTATHWACPTVLSLGFLYTLVAPLFGGFRSYHGRVVREHEAPALFSLVGHLSEHLGVKAPKRIEVNNETAIRVDAYAGINSIYRDDYKLVIGAPLLVGMNLNQIAAMLAHELSHFRNKKKKVAFYLMHHVSEWLYFRATGQDKRHQRLLSRMQKENLARYEYIELWLWQRIHKVQQGIFAGMFSLHRTLTAWQCRKIELETDAAAVAVVGAKDFASMIRQLRVIQSSQNEVSKQNDWAWKEGFLLDDYAMAVAVESQQSVKKLITLVEKNYSKAVTRFCPSDSQRLKHARELGGEGLLSAKVPGSYLLQQCKKLCRELTLLDYESTGIEQPERFVLSANKIRQMQQRKQQVLSIANRYFDGRVESRVMKFEPTEERDVSNFDVQTCIDYIRRHRVEDRKLQSSASSLLSRIHKAYTIERLLQSNLPLKKYLGDEVVPRKNAEAYLEYMRAQYQQMLYHMEAMDQVFYQRAKEARNYLDMKSRQNIEEAFENLELYCQFRRNVMSLEEAFKPLNLIVNGLQQGVSTKILQAGVQEKQQTWMLIGVLRKELSARPIMVSLQGKKVHFLKYLDFKLGQLPQDSSHWTVEEMADYMSQLLQLLNFQYHKWQSQIALVLTRFEKENDITPVNLLH